LDCKTQLNEDLQARIDLWLAADEALGVPEPHRRRLLARGGSSENPLPTALSALMIHGLYDSPQVMADLAEVIADHSINTIVSRMRGHFEADRSVLERTVHWEEWLSDAGADFVLAKELGSKVVLLGHSTGALLVTWLAIRDPHQVAGLILLSPAFGVHPLALTGAWASQLTVINLATSTASCERDIRVWRSTEQSGLLELGLEPAPKTAASTHMHPNSWRTFRYGWPTPQLSLSSKNRRQELSWRL
jgi:pimeloyl-ACP methyl ester carboxylesterase